MIELPTTAALSPLPLGAWTFTGHLGRRIDTILKQRITSDFARDQIHPELIETLRARVDDQIHPGWGMWQGEFWGKWMLSAVEATSYLDDEDLKALIRESVDQVLATQDANGYIGTYQNPDFLIPAGQRPLNWNIWGRKYILWGLLSAWRLLEDDRILESAAAMTDHLMTQVGPGKVDLIRTGALFGLPSTSILTPIIMLYEVTAEPRYLQFAEYIVDQWARHPSGPPDILHKGLENRPVHTWFPEPDRWAKSYEFMSCVEGLLHLYRVTGRGYYRDAVVNIYHQLRTWERSTVGSISFNDKFVGSTRLINLVGEICDVVYWNRLSFELFHLTGNTVYADEFERSLYNALLTGMSPDGTWGLRRLRLSHEHIPAHHHCNLAHQQCCVANAPRGLLQAAEMAWMTDRDGVRCVLYAPGRGTVELPSGQAATIHLAGSYARDGFVRLNMHLKTAETFTLRLRIPEWSRTTTIEINGQAMDQATAGGWYEVTRTWSDDNVILLSFDMQPRAERFDASQLPADDPLVLWANDEWAKLKNVEPGAPPSPFTLEDALPHADAIALLRGPLVLARDVRLSDNHLFEPDAVAIDPEDLPGLEPIEPPEGIWLAFSTKGQTDVQFCDFASAGNTWDTRSQFNTWIPVRKK